jgi:hypothetical protein
VPEIGALSVLHASLSLVKPASDGNGRPPTAERRFRRSVGCGVREAGGASEVSDAELQPFLARLGATRGGSPGCFG